MDIDPTSFASDLLYGFDIQDVESHSFLRSPITSGTAPDDEVRELWQLALPRGQEEWDMTFACAASLHDRAARDVAPEEDPGFMAYLTFVRAGEKEREEFLTKHNLKGGAEKDKQKKQRAPRRATSKFWEDSKVTKKDVVVWRRKEEEVSVKRNGRVGDEHMQTPVQRTEDSTSTLETIFRVSGHTFEDKRSPSYSPLTSPSLSPSSSPQPSPQPIHYLPLTPRSRAYKSSPFFTTIATPKKSRPPGGTISSLPIPPLSSPRFGLIQESLSHDPFALLVAVTFLIKTAGKAAIPIFHRVMERFPTPEAFLEVDLEEELVPMIKPLGLAGNRVRFLRRYAEGWIGEERPRPGRRWEVKGYPRRKRSGLKEEAGDDGMWFGKPPGARGGSADGVGIGGGGTGGLDNKTLEVETPREKKARSKVPSSEWEVGHLTQGPYAIDSWRIFCRDIFLGKSDNWMGRDEDKTWEPEWKRVLPDDKELRACLRWMWMKEGWEWDPETGEKTPLKEEMICAVDEGRVGYDDQGGLVIHDVALSRMGVE